MGPMVELSAWLNIVGLCFDIFGVVLIFLFGLPPMIDPEGHLFVYKKRKNVPDIKPVSTYRRWARTGLGLLIFGFSLQAAGSAVILL